MVVGQLLSSYGPGDPVLSPHESEECCSTFVHAFADDIAQRVLGTMASETRELAASLHRLSDREKQIAFLVARGLKNRDIAAQLTISENTVKRHLQSIFAKTGSRDRLELAVLALTELSQAA